MKNVQKYIEYWQNAADRSWKTAEDLLQTKHYDACLFFCHLSVEKALKGLFTRENNSPVPFIHVFVKIAHLAKLELNEKQITQLREITTFNIAGRYDDEKLSFYKKCTKKFTKSKFIMVKEIFLWLRKEYQKKS